MRHVQKGLGKNQNEQTIKHPSSYFAGALGNMMV
jgi:hypothetical protein